MSPTVTWAIAVRNGMPYLPQALASIERQTIRDFTLLAWDNGSTDGTIDELHRWIPARLPGSVITGQAMPLGLSRAEMVRRCHTEFIALADADDVNDPRRLQCQLDFMREHPGIAVLGTQVRKIDAVGVDHGVCWDYPLTHTEIVAGLLATNTIAQPSVIFRRDAVLAAGNYRNFSPTPEDYELWLRLAAQGFRLANLPQPLVGYRVHQKSTTQQAIARQQLETAMIQVLMETGPALFDSPPRTLERLRRRRSWCALPALNQIATHLDRAWANEGYAAWRSPAFLNASRSLLWKGDVLSRLVVARAMKRKGALRLELELILKMLLHGLTLRQYRRRLSRPLVDSAENEANP